MDYALMDKYEKRRLAFKLLIYRLGKGAQKKISEKIEVEPSYVSRMCYEEGKAGKKRIGEDIVEKLDKAYPDWLNQDDDLPPNSFKVNPDKISYVPVIGKAMGGLPDKLFTDEGKIVNGHDEYGEVYSNDKNAFITRVEGNSMYPKYHHGGFALIEPNTEPEIEDEVLIKIAPGKVMLKKLISRRGGVILASYNDQEIFTFSDEEIIWMYYAAYPVPARKIKNRL